MNIIITIDAYHPDGTRKGIDVVIPDTVFSGETEGIVDLLRSPLNVLKSTQFQTIETDKARIERIKSMIGRYNG